VKTRKEGSPTGSKAEGKMTIFRRLQYFLLALPVLLFVSPVHAQDFPNRIIRIVVPFPPGGTSDVVAREIAQEMSNSIGQQVVVDNRPGASGMIGANYVAKAAPDGYTILLSTPGPITINPHLFSNMTYDAEKDLAPITQIGTVPQILVVHPSVKANSVRELIDLAKANPGKLNYGSVGIGSTLHLAGELFNTSAGTQLVHIPYKGSAPALSDLLGGQIDLMFDVILSSLPLVKAGNLRALAVTGSKRSSSAPDIPTIAESGVPGYDVVTWYGLMAPGGTPPAVIATLNKDIVRALNTPAVQKRLNELGADLVGSSPQEFSEYLKRESEMWAGVVKKAHIAVAAQ
jgi:tripartite-type tricarboxylate transporter receptor subunit TctC